MRTILGFSPGWG